MKTLAVQVRAKPSFRAAPQTRTRRGLQVVAFRDEHRAQILTETAREFLHAYNRGVEAGPEAAMPALQSVTDPNIHVLVDSIGHRVSGYGSDALKQMIAEGHKGAEADKAQKLREVICAANDEEDCVFCLLETKYPKAAGYQVVKLDVLLDETARRVESLRMRGQQTPSAAEKLARPSEAGYDLHPFTPFPFDHVEKRSAQEMDPSKMQNVSQGWCDARSSGKSEDVLDGILAPDFKLWDAYGVLPVLCDPAKRAQPDACVVPRAAIKDIVRSMKDRYHISCDLQESAFSTDNNVGFTHWISHITNKQTGEEFKVDGMEVEIYDRDGKLRDIWLFRDPMDFEKDTLDRLRAT